MQDFARCTSFWTYLRFFAAIFWLEICTLAQETHQLCFNNRYEYISNSDFRKHQDSRTWFRKYLPLLDVSHLHQSYLPPPWWCQPPLWYWTPWRCRWRTSRYNWSIWCSRKNWDIWGKTDGLTWIIGARVSKKQEITQWVETRCMYLGSIAVWVSVALINTVVVETFLSRFVFLCTRRRWLCWN